jgi:hypothetical protein
MGLLELKPGNPDYPKIRWESRSHDTSAISAKATDFTIFARPAAQQLLKGLAKKIGDPRGWVGG